MTGLLALISAIYLLTFLFGSMVSVAGFGVPGIALATLGWPVVVAVGLSILMFLCALTRNRGLCVTTGLLAAVAPTVFAALVSRVGSTVASLLSLTGVLSGSAVALLGNQAQYLVGGGVIGMIVLSAVYILCSFPAPKRHGAKRGSGNDNSRQPLRGTDDFSTGSPGRSESDWQ